MHKDPITAYIRSKFIQHAAPKDGKIPLLFNLHLIEFNTGYGEVFDELKGESHLFESFAEAKEYFMNRITEIL